MPDRPVFIAAFRDLDRWSHEAVLRRTMGAESHEAAWPAVRLGDVIADLQNGWSPKCHDRPAEGDEWGVLKLGAVSGRSFNPRENKALPSALPPRPRWEIAQNDVLIVRGSGVSRLVGSVCLVEEVQPKLMFSDLIFRVVFHQDGLVDPRFLVETFKTGALREQIEDRRTGAAPMMQKITKPALLALTFPLPPLETQRGLVAALAEARSRAAALRGAAVTARSEARAAFESAVYATE